MYIHLVVLLFGWAWRCPQRLGECGVDDGVRGVKRRLRQAEWYEGKVMSQEAGALRRPTVREGTLRAEWTLAGQWSLVQEELPGFLGGHPSCCL